MYSEQEALDLIQQNPEQYKTLDSLRALADKVSLEASGKFTLLYGGQLGDLHTRTIVEALVNANEDEGGGGTLDNPQPPETVVRSTVTERQSDGSQLSVTRDGQGRVRTHKFIANNDQMTLGNGQNTAKTPMADPARPAGAEGSGGLAAGGVVQGSGSGAKRHENHRKE